MVRSDAVPGGRPDFGNQEVPCHAGGYAAVFQEFGGLVFPRIHRQAPLPPEASLQEDREGGILWMAGQDGPAVFETSLDPEKELRQPVDFIRFHPGGTASQIDQSVLDAVGIRIETDSSGATGEVVDRGKMDVHHHEP